MSTCQDLSTGSSPSEEEVDTDVEESRQKGDKLRYNQPIFTGDEGKVTQAPKGGRIKHKVVLEYSSNEVSESQLDKMVSPECLMAEDVAKIKRTKKSVKLTIPCHPIVEGLTESFIAWFKDHGMTTSLKKALRANRWTEQMIHEFKWAYIRKYKISQDYVMRYPDQKMSDEDELEGGGLADLVGPQEGDAGRTMTRTTAGTSGSKGGGDKRPVSQKEKDSEKGPDESTSGRTTRKKRAKKTSPPDPSRDKKKKVVKCKKDRGGEPGSAASEPPPEKKQKKERKKKKKKEVEANSAEPAQKKKKTKGTPSAALRRVPNTELLLVPEVPPGAAPVVMEQRSSMDEQLEAHLLGADSLATVAQPSQTASSSTAPQVLELESFLTRLRESIPRGRAQQAVVATPLLRWPQANLDTSSCG